MSGVIERTKLVAAIALLMAALVAMFAMSGCSDDKAAQQKEEETTEAVLSDQDQQDLAAQTADLRIASMKGPTSVGLAHMMEQKQAQFQVVAAADEVAALLTQDKVDIACVPANLAATLYNKTKGAVQVIDINTLGVLNVVTADKDLTTIDSLKGHTIYMTGANTVPEYTFRALLAANKLSVDDVDIQFKSEPTEVAALLQQEEGAVGILPQPYATALTMKNDDLQITIDLTKAWEETMSAEDGQFVTGVTIAKASFLKDHAEQVAAFLQLAANSVVVADTDSGAIAPTVVDLGIIENEKLAEKAIPNCNVVCITGAKMKEDLGGYLKVLFDTDPKAVGGALPEDGFYYNAD